jgi:hypothetical protein
MTQVLEGTWEEIATHAPEWNGKRLRVEIEVLDRLQCVTSNDVAIENEPQMLDKWLEGYIGVIDGPETNIAARSEELWGEYVEEKHRRIKERGSKRDIV